MSCTGPVTHIIVDCETSTVPYALILTCYPSCGLLMSHNICFSTKWLTIFSHRTCYHHYCQLRLLQTQTFCNPLYGLCTVCYPVRPVCSTSVSYHTIISMIYFYLYLVQTYNIIFIVSTTSPTRHITYNQLYSIVLSTPYPYAFSYLLPEY